MTRTFLLGFSLILMVPAIACAQFHTHPNTLPSADGEALRLHRLENGTVAATWFEKISDTSAWLQISNWQGKAWGEPITLVKVGRSGLVNWIETPDIARYAHDDNSLAVSWLEVTNPRNPYDHHIIIKQSFDKGNSWSSTFKPYHTNIQAYFGQINLCSISKDRMLAVWQDGRETKVQGPGGRTFPNPEGRIKLMATEFGRDGNIKDETSLADFISEISPMDLAPVQEGAVVVFRTNNEEKVRNIAIARYSAGQWSSDPLIVQDNWMVTYPPMDAPKVDAIGNQVAFIWYSGANDTSQIKLIFSGDAGKTFSKPIRIDTGLPLGKPDICWISNKHLLASWLETYREQPHLTIVKLNTKGKILKKQRFLIAGNVSQVVPCLAGIKKGAIIGWKELVQGKPVLKTLRVQ